MQSSKIKQLQLIFWPAINSISKVKNLTLKHTCSSISCSWRGLAFESMSMATSLPRLLDSSCINTELPEKNSSEQSY